MNSLSPLLRVLTALILLGCTLPSHAQLRCGTPAPATPPAFILKQASKPGTATYTVPVVVHVIETSTALGTPQKPSDAQIIASIDALNKTFSATYPGYPGTGNGGVDMGFRFALAQRDPDCNPTTGIVRIDKSHDSAYINSFITPADGQVLYNLSHWNTQEYCNLYIVPNITYANGFAQFPGTPATFFDGVAIHCNALPVFYNYFAPYIVPNPMHTITHEFGHYLGLYHTFNQANDPTCPNNADCTTMGDVVCDTDPHLTTCGTPTCNATTINPCTGQPFGNVYHNYMSYFVDTIGLFTQGQKTRMIQQSTQYRPYVLNGLGLDPPSPVAPSVFINAANLNPYSPYCPGNPLEFSVSGQGHGSSPVYAWYINGVLTTTTSSQAPLSFTLNASDTVTCKLTSSALCVTTPTMLSNKLTVPVLSAGTLSVSLTHQGNDTICVGDSLLFDCLVANTGSYAYVWYNSFNNPIVGMTNAHHHSICDTSQVYLSFSPRWLYMRCEVYATSHCTTPTYMQVKDSVYVTIRPAPPTLSFGQGYLQCSPALHYQWYSVSTGLINGATSQTYTPTQNGDYYCVVRDTRCGSAPSDTLSFLDTGIESPGLGATLDVFPNPATQQVTVASRGIALQNVELQSLSGQPLLREPLQGTRAVIDLHGLPGGVYLLKIQAINGAAAYKKLLIVPAR